MHETWQYNPQTDNSASRPDTVSFKQNGIFIHRAIGIKAKKEMYGPTKWNCCFGQQSRLHRLCKDTASSVKKLSTSCIGQRDIIMCPTDKSSPLMRNNPLHSDVFQFKTLQIHLQGHCNTACVCVCVITGHSKISARTNGLFKQLNILIAAFKAAKPLGNNAVCTLTNQSFPSWWHADRRSVSFVKLWYGARGCTDCGWEGICLLLFSCHCFDSTFISVPPMNTFKLPSSVAETRYSTLQ